MDRAALPAFQVNTVAIGLMGQDKTAFINLRDVIAELVAQLRMQEDGITLTALRTSFTWYVTGCYL